ncbi:MAG: hypothetical protein L0I24_24760 [Pseudonocardia sp.]|nr:hypothetical protein [Pseudonocardia sp.]
MHTPGFEFALALHRADLRRHADDHRTAVHRARGLAGPRFPGLRALVTVAAARRPAPTTALATTAAATMAEAQPCPP